MKSYGSTDLNVQHHFVIGKKNDSVKKALMEIIRKYKGFMVYDTHDNDVLYDVVHVVLPFIPVNNFFGNIALSMNHAAKDAIILLHSAVKPGTSVKLMKKYPNVVYSPLKPVYQYYYSFDSLLNAIKFNNNYFMGKNEKVLRKVGRMYDKMNVFGMKRAGDPTILEYALIYGVLKELMNIVLLEEIYILNNNNQFDDLFISSFVEGIEMDSLIDIIRQKSYINDEIFSIVRLLDECDSSIASMMLDYHKRFLKKYR